MKNLTNELMEMRRNYTWYIDNFSYGYLDGRYIDDEIMSEADNQTDIYYNQLDKWFIEDNNSRLVEDYINEYGWSGDIYKAIQGAQCMALYNEMAEAREDILKYYYTTALIELVGEEMNEEVYDYMLNDIDCYSFDTFPSLEDIEENYNYCREIVEG